MTKIFLRLIIGFCISVTLLGCSHTIHKRDPDEHNPQDSGSETQIQLRGPRAVLQHKF